LLCKRRHIDFLSENWKPVVEAVTPLVSSFLQWRFIMIHGGKLEAELVVTLVTPPTPPFEAKVITSDFILDDMPIRMDVEHLVQIIDSLRAQLIVFASS
jgi:hypothetical protein